MGVLIIIAFLAVIYGMYSKISMNDNKIAILPVSFSANLNSNETIKNIEVINNTTLLILIESGKNNIGLIYDLNKNEIITKINK